MSFVSSQRLGTRFITWKKLHWRHGGFQWNNFFFMHHTFCHHCLLHICKSAMMMNCHISHIELYVSKQVDEYVRLMLRIEQCYGMDMCCSLYYVPWKWHTSDDQKGYIILISDVWFEVCMNCHIMKTILFLFLLWFNMWHVTSVGRNTLGGLCICISHI